MAMMILPSSLRLLAGLPLLWLGAGGTPSVTEVPGVAWVRHLGEAGRYYRAQALARSPRDRTFVIAGISTPSVSGGPGSFWLWRLDASGQVRQQVQIDSPLGEAKLNPAYSYFGGATVLANGDVLLIIEFAPGQPSLVRVDQAGRVLAVKSAAEPGTTITKLVAVDEGRFLLVGRQASDAVAVKVDAQGNRIWARRFDHGEAEGFVDVVALEGGGFLGVANIGKHDPALGDRVWVLRCSRDGTRDSDLVLPGRNAAVTRAKDGSYALVYDEQKGSFSHDAWLQTLDADLKPLKKFSVLAPEPGFSKPHGVAALPGGGFFIAGSRGVGLWLARVDAAGRQVWSWSDSPRPVGEGGGPVSWLSELRSIAATDSEALILASVQRVGAAAGDDFKVGVLSLALR